MQHLATSWAAYVRACFDQYTAFIKAEAAAQGLVIDDPIAEMLAVWCPVLAGSSGGKDSDVLVLTLDKFLDAIWYGGERVVIHADLGRIEHAESIGQVRKLAERVGWRLEVVRREKGGLLERYEQRWHDNCARYARLECVTLISPFPIPTSAPFCRSETKVAPILQKAVKLFPGRQIINAVGLRREESPSRAKKPVSRVNEGLSRADGTGGRDFYPILDILERRVWQIHREEDFGEHAQYGRGNKRISCAYCFLGKEDWKHALKVESNHPAYCTLCALEIRSGFGYTQSAWLIDEPDGEPVLPVELRERRAEAKGKAERRRLVERRVPEELKFENHGGRQGWPKSQPTLAQCALIAEVRREMSALMGEEIRATTGLEVRYTTAEEVYDRYAELLILKGEREARRAKREKGRGNGSEASLPEPPTAHSPCGVVTGAQPGLF
jgi:3'-phosphoadenosine 5'-phosphosulfate sulfotransferase (PAPS reductase)/FAD synthetase